MRGEAFPLPLRDDRYRLVALPFDRVVELHVVSDRHAVHGNDPISLFQPREIRRFAGLNLADHRLDPRVYADESPPRLFVELGHDLEGPDLAVPLDLEGDRFQGVPHDVPGDVLPVRDPFAVDLDDDVAVPQARGLSRRRTSHAGYLFALREDDPVRIGPYLIADDDDE